MIQLNAKNCVSTSKKKPKTLDAPMTHVNFTYRCSILPRNRKKKEETGKVTKKQKNKHKKIHCKTKKKIARLAIWEWIKMEAQPYPILRVWMATNDFL